MLLNFQKLSRLCLALSCKCRGNLKILAISRTSLNLEKNRKFPELPGRILDLSVTFSERAEIPLPPSAPPPSALFQPPIDVWPAPALDDLDARDGRELAAELGRELAAGVAGAASAIARRAARRGAPPASPRAAPRKQKRLLKWRRGGGYLKT